MNHRDDNAGWDRAAAAQWSLTPEPERDVWRELVCDRLRWAVGKPSVIEKMAIGWCYDPACVVGKPPAELLDGRKWTGRRGVGERTADPGPDPTGPVRSSVIVRRTTFEVSTWGHLGTEPITMIDESKQAPDEPRPLAMACDRCGMPWTDATGGKRAGTITNLRDNAKAAGWQGIRRYGGVRHYCPNCAGAIRERESARNTRRR